MTKSSRSESGAALAGFLLGSALTIVTSIAWTKLCQSKKNQQEQNANEKNKVGTTATSSAKSAPKRLPDDIREEQLSRHTLYFGEEGMKKLRGASVAVVGLGGVGSHTAHMLARAGVSYLRLIDFDQVSVSSLNRHACATLADVGIPKATCLKDFLEQICPDPRFLNVDAVVQMYTAESGDQLLGDRQWDFVIDAIDDVPTKAALVAQCAKNDWKCVACMGAGGKSDLTRLHISDLRTATRDPLASKLRLTLKRLLPKDKLGFIDNMEQLAVVYSSEKTVAKLADFTDEQKADGVHHYGAVDGMRIRVLPVLGTMPAVMGQTCAAFALCELGQKSFQPVTGERVGRNVRHRMLQHLKRREKKIRDEVEGTTDKEDKSQGGFGEPDEGHMVDGKWVGSVQVDGDDMEYLMEIWRNRCAVTGERLGVVLELARWDLSKASTCNNLVLMSAKAMQKFDKEGISSVPEAVQQEIERRLNSCRLDAKSY